MDINYAKYLLEKTQKDYDLIAEKFSKFREKPWPEGKFLVDNWAKRGEKILDLGCGPGQWFEFFKEKEIDYFGVDFSKKMIEMAQRKYPQTKFFIAPAFNLPFSDNFFDKVYAIALFHHIPSKGLRKLLLEEIKRVLKKDGFLILTCWNLWQKWRTKKLIYKFILLKIIGKSKLDFRDILMDWQGMKNCYFHCFTKRELRDLIKENQFKIIKEGEFLVGREKGPKLPNSNFYIIAKKLL